MDKSCCKIKDSIKLEPRLSGRPDIPNFLFDFPHSSHPIETVSHDRKNEQDNYTSNNSCEWLQAPGKLQSIEGTSKSEDAGEDQHLETQVKMEADDVQAALAEHSFHWNTVSLPEGDLNMIHPSSQHTSSTELSSNTEQLFPSFTSDKDAMLHSIEPEEPSEGKLNALFAGDRNTYNGVALQTSTTLGPQTEANPASGTSVGVKSFQCAVCNNTFKSKQSLAVHGRIHSGEKPYKCDQCPARFTQGGDLTVHKRKHSGGYFETSLTPVRSESFNIRKCL